MATPKVRDWPQQSEWDVASQTCWVRPPLHPAAPAQHPTCPSGWRDAVAAVGAGRGTAGELG